MNRFASFQTTTPVSLASISTFNLNLIAGYNLITENNLTMNLELLPGDLIQITGLNSASIAVDTSGTASLSDYIVLNTSLLTPLNSYKNTRFFIRAIVSPFTKVNLK